MGIRLSEKHGVNPSISTCFYCGQDKNELILAGKMKGDVEAPRRAVWSKEPCDQCKGFMKKGIICISVDEEKTTDKENPYRTGCFAVVKQAVIERAIQPQELVDDVLKKRVCFIPDDAWDKLGFPREDLPNGR